MSSAYNHLQCDPCTISTTSFFLIYRRVYCNSSIVVFSYNISETQLSSTNQRNSVAARLIWQRPWQVYTLHVVVGSDGGLWKLSPLWQIAFLLFAHHDAAAASLRHALLMSCEIRFWCKWCLMTMKWQGKGDHCTVSCHVISAWDDLCYSKIYKNGYCGKYAITNGLKNKDTKPHQLVLPLLGSTWAG